MKINIPHIFTQKFKHLDKIEFFRKVLYIVLLVNTITLLPIAYELWGYYGLIGTRGWNTGEPWYYQGSHALVNVLSHPANSKYDWVWVVFVIGQLLALTMGIFKIFPRFSAFLIYFFTINLFNKGYLAFTGGESLVNIMLFYNMFIHKPKREDLFGHLQNVLNNSFYWIMLIQVCILYFMSAWYKLMDPHWISGHAMMYTSRITSFGSTMLSPIEDSYILSAIATYSSLAYQALFPIAVWFKRIKIPFLLFGVLFHLLIAFGMGVFTFGIIMIVMYILFLDDKQIQWLKKKLSFKRKSTKVESSEPIAQ